MNFFLLANNDTDGIGQTLINLSSNLKKKNHNVKIGILHSKSKNNEVKLIKRKLTLRIISFLLNFLKIKKLITFKNNFNELFWFNNSTIDYSSIKKDIEESDVIIIFTFHKIISTKIFEQIMKSGKIIFLRPLDLELATGGCHFNDDCHKFEENCNKCPKLNFLNFFNITKRNIEEKRRIVNTYNPKILVQNTFVEKIFLKSSVFKNSETKIVRLDTRLERKNFYDKEKARNFFKFNKDENLILFGAFDLSSHLKGGHLLLKALKLLDLEIEKQNKDNQQLNTIRLLTIGRKNNFNLNLQNIEWTHLGRIYSDKELNLLYRAVDLLVCPSLRCFAPHIVSEAVENNLPVVSFDVGVAQDDIINGKNGFLVPCYDVSIFSKKIFEILFDENFKHNMNKFNKKIELERNVDEASTIINFARKLLNNRA
jgi:glycosyltransferase involved in cell wall biosynthesis